MPPPIQQSRPSTKLAGVPVEAAVERRAEAQYTYVTTRETTNARDSCVSQSEAPAGRDDPDDVNLIGRLQARDQSAFRAIVERYATRIYRVAYGIVRDPDAAERIAQEAFVKVYFSVPSFPLGSSLYMWMHRIAVNECYKYVLTQGCRLDFPAEATTEGRPASDRAVARSKLLNTLLAHLPEDDRWLLVSREVEGVSLFELSQMTGLNENEIKSRLLLVRQRLIAAADELRAIAGPATI
jgi:RNA polymerase sigma-70 factor (ECF subfamily)